MSDVKRWQNWCAVTHGHGMSEDPEGMYVTAYDYGILQARLAEAERLLRYALALLDEPRVSVASKLADHIRDFLRAADSASLGCQHNPRCLLIEDHDGPCEFDSPLKSEQVRYRAHVALEQDAHNADNK